MNSKTYSDFRKASAEGGDRLGYIADDYPVAENDIESGPGDFGVWKYDKGRFLSSIIKYEQYRFYETIKNIRKIKICRQFQCFMD